MKDSKWDKFILKNIIAKTRVGTFLVAGFFALWLDIHMGISWAFDIESSDLKVQIHLRVQDCNCDEGFEVIKNRFK
jgi:hypothetical protein